MGKNKAEQVNDVVGTMKALDLIGSPCGNWESYKWLVEHGFAMNFAYDRRGASNACAHVFCRIMEYMSYSLYINVCDLCPNGFEADISAMQDASSRFVFIDSIMHEYHGHTAEEALTSLLPHVIDELDEQLSMRRKP